MPEYTAADFAAARFAEAPDTGEMAVRNRTGRPAGPWESNIGYYFDEDMAALGFRPVREAAPLSLAALREAWEAAEVITDDNLPRKGDEVIEGQSGRSFRVFVLSVKWTAPGSPAYRILHRRSPRRPEGAEKLAAVVSGMPDGLTADERADWLAERGVRVVSNDE